jgi:chromosomal replication initiation ATPase DnaA
MKSQLILTFGETLAYSSETFVAHAGVREVTETLVTLSAEGRFGLIYVHGLAGAGKTHLSVYCAGLLQSLGCSVDVASASKAHEWMMHRTGRGRVEKGCVLCVDDADSWLSQPHVEGGFTAVADALTQAKGLLVLMSSVSVGDLRVSNQVKSRLVAGVQLEIGPPEEDDLDPILRAMSKQRGLKLTEPKRRFILARVPRTLPALSNYMTKLHDLGQRAASSTSFDVLAQALV